MKQCNVCGQLLPEENFSKSNAAKDGLQRTCKACQSKYNKQHKEKKTLEKKEETLAKFTPRELMAELYKRGYRGKLTYTQEITVNIEAIGNDK